MNFKEWITAISRTGSEDDPIRYQGKETTPTRLSYEFSPFDKIKGVRIEFYHAGKGRIIGTCGSMLRERRGY